jgi:hypothetical protein
VSLLTHLLDLMRQLWQRISLPRFTPACGININPDVPTGQPRPADLPGVGWVRLVLKIDALHLTGVDQAAARCEPIIAGYASAGISTLLILNQETVWSPAPWANGWDAPTHTAYVRRFANTAGQIAARLKGYPVAYEIWNEGDIKGESSIYYPPEQFAALLSATAEAIRAADPTAPLVLGGLAAAPHESIAYLQAVVNTLAGPLPVDALGLHPYGKWPPPYTSAPPIQGGWFGDLTSHLTTFRKAFPSLPLWITEIGLSEEAPLPPNQWPEAARYLRRVYALTRDRFGKHIPVVIWFAWTDEMRNAGLVDATGKPKTPIYNAFFTVAKQTKVE